MSDRVVEHVTDGTPRWRGVKPEDPGPEVLWNSREAWGHQKGFRLLSTGEWQVLTDDFGWVAHPARTHPIEKELARRLLAERAEQEKLDEHNDEEELKALLEQEVEGVCLLGDLEARVKELDANLAREVERTSRLEAALQVAQQAILQLLERSQERAAPASSGAATEPPQVLRWDRWRNLMVNNLDHNVLDLSDYDNLGPDDHDLLERLADLWSAWGDKGYLRDRLYDTRFASVDTWRTENMRDWFELLRSELLAKVWKD